MNTLKTKRHRVFLLVVCFCSQGFFSQSVSQSTRTNVYYPPPPGAAWQKRKPEDAGMDSALLDQAVAYARTQPSTMPADFSTQVETFGRPFAKDARRYERHHSSPRLRHR